VNILFWNLGRKPLGLTLGILAHENEADVLVTVENCISSAEICEQLNEVPASGIFTEEVSPAGSAAVRIFSRLDPGSVLPVDDMGRVTARCITPISGPEIILVACHLPGKRYQHTEDQADYVNRILVPAILEVERERRHRRTMVIGDFNMNPFEPGMTGSNHLHAVSCSRIAGRTSRKVSGKDCAFFYNPMWSLMGDRSEGPPGTYYYAGGRSNELFWHSFDQAILRPELLPALGNGLPRILTSAGGESLLTENGVPNSLRYSDHLPLFLKLNTDNL
jgi:endonuclease/exonuclease/phosphatase family metal-dependent hydrolase